jgi:hypothetical protein
MIIPPERLGRFALHNTVQQSDIARPPMAAPIQNFHPAA